MLVFVDHLVSDIVDVFILLDLLWMVYDHISLEVKFRSIHLNIFRLFHGLFQIFLHHLVPIRHNTMLEEVFPFDALFRVNSEHASENIFADI